MNDISTGEAALRAQMSRERLMRRIHSGAIKAKYVVGRWLVDARSVDEYVNREQPEEPVPVA